MVQPASLLQAQDSALIRRHLNALCSPEMHGRGYLNNGLKMAENYITSQLEGLGLQVQLQPFTFPVNTFPGKQLLQLNEKALTPGRDYLVGTASPSVSGSFEFEKQDSTTLVATNKKLVLHKVKKLTWSAADQVKRPVQIQVLEQAFPGGRVEAQVQVSSTLNPAFTANNIMALVPGTRVADSMIVFTAHYDHLGAMGPNAVFAGANDNASGVAMLLALARRVAEQPLEYTTVFLFFAGEEAGLVGSNYFVFRPMVPLAKIRFLLNLDLMGNGEEGITVVNATEYAGAFSLLLKINDEHELLSAITSRGKAINSDHYWFSEYGVPSFFWYTMGARKAYHDVDDVPETLPLYEANDLVKLALLFARQIIHSPVY